MEASAFTFGEAPDDRPWPGKHCTVCRNGILYPLAETDEGFYLGCFNCDTRGTVHKTEPWVASVPAGENVVTTPAGFTVSHEQARVQDAGGDPEAAAAASRRGRVQLGDDVRADYEQRIANLQQQLADRDQPEPPAGKKASS